MQYHYSEQVRKFLIQFAKIFSMIEVTKGIDPNGNPVLVRIPVMYGDSSRQAATIIANNSASNLPSVPLITYYVTGIDYEQTRTQNPTFVEKLQVRQRLYNSVTKEYEQKQGQAYTVERLMPVPYKLSMSVDFWTSNTNQKFEIFEQLAVLFNPGLEIQSTDNFLDWTSLSAVFQNGLTFSSRTVTQGTSNSIDIMSWKFYMPIWVSAPAKLKKMGVVQKIINSIHQGSALEDMQDDDLLMGTRQKITPYGYQILYLNNSLQVLPSNQPKYEPNTNLNNPDSPNTNIYWSAFLNMYGVIRPGVSQIWLENEYMDAPIVGTIVVDPIDDRLIIYNVDTETLPTNTLSPVNGVIDPRTHGPSVGLPGSVDGRRYLILHDIGSSSSTSGIVIKVLGTVEANNYIICEDTTGLYTNMIIVFENNIGTINKEVTYRISSVINSTTFTITTTLNGVEYIMSNSTLTVYARQPDVSSIWGNLVAYSNDIIEYKSSTNEWFVSFDSNLYNANHKYVPQYVLNLNTNIQYRYVEGSWAKSVEGFYDSGNWSLVI